MIKTFRHKGLKELFEQGATSRIDRQFHRRLIERLDVLNRAASPQALTLPGYNVHPLRGKPAKVPCIGAGLKPAPTEWDHHRHAIRLCERRVADDLRMGRRRRLSC